MLRKGMFISDRYEILDKVGSGGMSDVYKAKCHKLNRFVAIKVLKQEFSQDTNFVSKFKVEAQNAAGLSHPNIVNVYDVGEDGGLHYIVMELIEGITLKRYIDKKGQLPVKEAVSIAIQVGQGIEAAHNNHIIHRDIKPQNIIISREGKVKVTDFGIARAASANTINSNAMGSVHYISPEQARGGFIDEKSDIYSLGITLYEMLTGRVPFEGDSTVTIALQHVQEEIPSAKLYVPDLPISVEKILLKCTQKKPEHRYLKVSSFIADLKRSLVTPDEDFVQLVQTNNTDATVVITGEEIKQIRSDAGIHTDNYEDENDVNGYEYEDDGYDDEYENEDEYEEDGYEYEEEYEEEIEDDLENENPKLDKVIAIGGIVTGVVVLMIAVYLMLSFFGSGCGGGNKLENITTKKETEESTTLDAKHTKVPKLIGLTEEEAKKAVGKAELGYTISHKNSSTVEKGNVMSISYRSGDPLNEGDVIAKNTTIVLVISDGPKKVTIPNLSGMNKTEATSKLKDMKLQVTVEYVDDDEVDVDDVVKSDPEYGEEVDEGSEVTIYVSRGKEEGDDCVVPDLKGKTKAEARELLEEAGLNLGDVETVYDDADEGTVIGQSYKAKSKLPADSEVDIVISKGPKPTEPETEPTTEKKTTEKPTEPETEPTTEPQTEPVKYNASVSVRKSDIMNKLTLDENGEYAGQGVVQVKVDGQVFNGFTDSNFFEWPDEITFDLPERDSKGRVRVEIYVDVLNSPVYTTTATYK